MIVTVKCCDSGEAIAVEAFMLEYSIHSIIHNDIIHVPKVNVAKITAKNNEVIYVIAGKKDIIFISENSANIYAKAYALESHKSGMEEFIREMEKPPNAYYNVLNTMYPKVTQ